MKPAVEEVKDGTKYFLAGQEAVDAYIDGGVGEVIDEQVHNGDLNGILVAWDPSMETINDLLAKFEGCLEQIEILEEDYKELGEYD